VCGALNRAHFRICFPDPLAQAACVRLRIDQIIAALSNPAIVIMPHSESVGIELGQLALTPSHELGAQDGVPCVPGASTVHVPTWPARLQELHEPLHAVSQHTPSEQNPLEHVLGPLHAVPLAASVGTQPEKEPVYTPEEQVTLPVGVPAYPTSQMADTAGQTVPSAAPGPHPDTT
jgi:hypothetical protein